MPNLVCSADARTLKLHDLLVRDWGVAEAELDRGYGVVRKNGSAGVEGAGDGCSSYREVMEKALEVATSESLDCGGGSLVKLLDDRFNLRLPWVFYEDSFFKPADFDAEAWRAASSIVDRIRLSYEAKGGSTGTTKGLVDFARTIFEEIIPFDMMRKGEINPHTAVFKLFMAYRAAGIDSSFAIIPVDPMGLPTPTHVALEIDAGDGRKIVVDPAYERFDLTDLPAIPIGLTQALATYHARRALESSEPLKDLDLAHELDPNNSAIYEWRILSEKPGHDPLRSTRDSEDFFFGVARDAMRRERQGR